MRWTGKVEVELDKGVVQNYKKKRSADYKSENLCAIGIFYKSFLFIQKRCIYFGSRSFS